MLSTAGGCAVPWPYGQGRGRRRGPDSVVSCQGADSVASCQGADSLVEEVEEEEGRRGRREEEGGEEQVLLQVLHLTQLSTVDKR